MNKQDDLTAAARAEQLMRTVVMRVYQNVDDHGEIQDYETVEQAVREYILVEQRQTRQAALREARDYALACVHELAVQLDSFAGSSGMAGVIRGKQSEAQHIADTLDQLASEGG